VHNNTITKRDDTSGRSIFNVFEPCETFDRCLDFVVLVFDNLCCLKRMRRNDRKMYCAMLGTLELS